MITEKEALDQIIASVMPLQTIRVALNDALHLFSAKTLHATVPLPTFDNSAMDGYALRHADSQKRNPLRVTGEQAAGSSGRFAVEAGTAIRIFTGAPLPRGADAVIMQEDVTLMDEGRTIVCNEPVAPDENVRRAGCDLCAGQRIVDAGDRLTPSRLAVLASQGLRLIEVHSSPRVAVVTTGSELVEPGAPLEHGQIYNSNATMLAGLVRELGFMSITGRHVSDDPSRTAACLRELSEQHDFIILSGGVSVGDHDYVKPALDALQVPQTFWKVRIKPGKPFLFTQAIRADGSRCTILGLPGNPVSSFVTFVLFARPALLRAMGASELDCQAPRVLAKVSQNLRNNGNRPHYLRGRVEDGIFTPQGSQRSHAMFALSRSNALLRMDAESELPEGALQKVLLV